MENENIYYWISYHFNHVHQSLFIPSMDDLKIGKRSYSTDKLQIQAPDNENWKWTLENLDFIRGSFLIYIVSEKFKEAMEGLYTDETVQFLPAEITFKGIIYKHFYTLNPLIKMSIINPMESYWSVKKWRKDNSFRSASPYIEHCYDDAILKENYERYPHVHLFESFMSGGLHISKDVKEAIKKHKLKLCVEDIKPWDIWKPEDYEQGKTLSDEFREAAWGQEIRESYNYEFLKEKFDWVK